MPSTNSTPEPLPRIARWEGGVLAMLVAVVLLLNLLTAERSPTVWLDEVCYVDPAVNLLSGNGFVSSAWYGQTQEAFWAGNVPLHAFGLAGWMKVWGVGMVQARSLNYVLAALAALCFWRGALVGGWLKTSCARLGFATLLLSSFGICYSYRSGRPDALLLLLFAVIFHAWSAPGGPVRRLMLFVASALVPWAGLQGLPLLAVTGVFLLAWRKRAALADVAVLAGGSLTGVLGLVLLYHSHGVLDAFVASISSHHTLGQTLTLPELLAEKLGKAKTLLADVSLLALMGGSGLSLLLFRKRLGSDLVEGVCRGLSFAVLAALAVFSLGKFPLFYSWMAFVPVALSWAALLDGAMAGGAVAARNLLVGCGLVAAFLGLPLRLGVTVKEWDRRDYGPVRELVQKNITPEDCVFASFQAYHAVKPWARETLVSSYARAITPDEKERVTCLIIAPADHSETVHLIGGTWRDTGAAVSPRVDGANLGAKPYDLRIWRRVR